MYTTILFDAHNTLINFAEAERESIRTVLNIIGFPNDNLIDEFKKINYLLWKQVEMGQLSKSELETARFKLLLPYQTFTENDYFIINYLYLKNLELHLNISKQRASVCRALSHKYNLIVITNGTKKLINHIFSSDCNGIFSDIFDSADTGYSKPDIRYFDFVFSKSNIKNKSEVLLVGDSLSADITGGHNYGIDTCWYNPRRKVNCLSFEPTFEISEFKNLLSILY